MVAHCRAGYPNEACGILAGKGNEVSKIYRMTNAESSPVSYLMDSKEQFRVMKDIRGCGLSMVAIFHSHPSSEAYPSATDVRLASYDDCAYIVLSLAGKEPVARAFSIRDRAITEIEVALHPKSL